MHQLLTCCMKDLCTYSLGVHEQTDVLQLLLSGITTGLHNVGCRMLILLQGNSERVCACRMGQFTMPNGHLTLPSL